MLEGLTTGRDAPLDVRSGGIANRGVFATGPVKQGQWLCEYKGLVYTHNHMKKKIEKYDQNGEGCYIITSKYLVDGNRLC